MEWWHWVADIINISGNLTMEKEDSKEHIELLYEDLWKHYIDEYIYKLQLINMEKSTT